jgi:DNA polymerase III epsilon subunit-like protein
VRALWHRSPRRTQHGALLDAELLAAVYIELTTMRQAALQLEPFAPSPSFRQSPTCGPGRCRHA